MLQNLPAGRQAKKKEDPGPAQSLPCSTNYGKPRGVSHCDVCANRGRLSGVKTLKLYLNYGK